MEFEGSYRVHQNPLLDSALSQTNTVHTLFQLLKIHFNIISHLRLSLSNGPFPSGWPRKIVYAIRGPL